jgi:hypothetical protein
MKLPIFRSSSKSKMPFLYELFAYLRKHNVPQNAKAKIPYAYKEGKKKRLKHIRLLGWSCHFCSDCLDHHENVSLILPGGAAALHY